MIKSLLSCLLSTFLVPAQFMFVISFLVLWSQWQWHPQHPPHRHHHYRYRRPHPLCPILFLRELWPVMICSPFWNMLEPMRTRFPLWTVPGKVLIQYSSKAVRVCWRYAWLAMAWSERERKREGSYRWCMTMALVLPLYKKILWSISVLKDPWPYSTNSHTKLWHLLFMRRWCTDASFTIWIESTH